MKAHPSTPLPKDLEPFRKEGERLYHDGNVKALEFSRRTYQVLVEDDKLHESFWGFIHLNASGEVAECFCQCSDELEGDRCAHLAAGLFRIYNDKSRPLHMRYRKSFWRALGFVLFRHKTKISPGNEEGKRFLDEIFSHGDIPEEESSLKFSDLSEKELRAIRDGSLGDELRYELSPYSDVAKRLLWLQENSNSPEVSFEEDKSGLPILISVSCPQFSFELKLTDKELKGVIPYLSTIPSPLRLGGGFDDLIASAVYDEKEKTLVLEKSTFDIKKIKGKSFGDWIYVKGDGFYLKEHDPVLDMESLPKEKVESFLNSYPGKFKSLIHRGAFEKKGHLRFDKKGRLHITHYLFTANDLEAKGTRHFGEWVFIPEKGFFKTITPELLPKAEVIEKDSIYEWVLSHQAFLADVEGFHVHLRVIDPSISWHVDAEGALKFTSTLKGDFKKEPLEFGALIYVEGEGFFSKTSFKDALSFHSGSKIPKIKVPSYIRRHEDDLRLVQGFFLKQVPVEKGGVEITFDGDKIHVIPKIELHDAFKGKPMILYEDYLYIEGAGFYPLPEKNFLPLDFREEKLIPFSKAHDFFEDQFPRIKSFVQKMDDPLKVPKHLEASYADELYFTSEFGKVSFDELIKAHKKKSRYLFSKAGRIDLKEERFERLFRLFKESGYPKLSLMEVYKLKAYEDVNLNMKDFEKSLPLDYSDLNSRLRPYQKLGVEWLWFLYANGLSGLLCDDMGLGKTHQAMALMAGARALKTSFKRFLIVCPTSVLYHWEEKLQSFFPSIKVSVYHGQDRSLNEFREGGEILLTSYGILRRDISKIKEFDFEIAIYDEIQTAKNHLSKLWVTLKEIKAKMTLGLTGTPIENSLRELKALFDIVLPGLMPPAQEFLEGFLRPIERQEDSRIKALLHRMISPFLLRRKKEDVLDDLPEKTEEIAHAALLPTQKTLYDEFYLSAKRLIMSDLLDDMKAIPYIHIFSLISGLKKICDHPALFLREIDNYKHYESGKWELFTELLHEALGSEQKVVVFSHYLGMLDIIESYLLENGIGFSGLRGSTTNRKEAIARFREDPSCKVFAASLQAGGLGIDLTEASVVIHYDRWWNAAKENQATDRVHRIGQTRGVQVFKLVTKNTIEDRIHTLIEKKARRMEEIIGKDTADAVKTLTRDELIELFS